MTDLEHAFLEDAVELRVLSKWDKEAILEHQEDCKQCLKHLHNPRAYERCFAYAWWIRKAQFGKDVGADRRFPDSIQVVAVNQPNWSPNHTQYVVTITCVSSLQIWLYNNGFEHLVYHSYSDIE